MTRSSYIALCAACMLAVASAAAITTSLTTSAFNATPGKVFDGNTGAADITTWGTYTGAVFGAGTTNATVYAYGWALNGAGTSITKVVSRALNATLLSNGTADTTLASKQGDDAVYSTAITITGGPVTSVGLGSLGIAYIAVDTSSCSQVYVAIFNGGTASPTTKAVTAYTCTHCTQGTAGTGIGYVNSVTGLFFDNKTYFVTYTSTKYTETETAGGTGACTTGTTYPSVHNAITKGQVFAYLQGVGATGTLTWTAATALYSGTESANNAAPSPLAAAIQPSCAPGNFTNATTILCTTFTGASPNVLQYLSVTVSTGAAGSATTIATNVAAANPRVYPETVTAYTPAGFVRSQYQQGILINKFDTITASAGATATYLNTLQFYNLTSGATATAGGVTLNITNTYQGGQYSGGGLSFSSGWGLLDVYSDAANSYKYEWGTWLANGTTNGTKATFISGAQATGNVFIDANGALWAGAYSLDDAGTPDTLTTGYLGKLAAQVYSSSTYGNLLVTFFGLISLVIAALFVF